MVTSNNQINKMKKKGLTSDHQYMLISTMLVVFGVAMKVHALIFLGTVSIATLVFLNQRNKDKEKRINRYVAWFIYLVFIVYLFFLVLNSL